VINAIDIYSSLTNDNIPNSKPYDWGTDLNRAYNIPSSAIALLTCVFKPKKVKLMIGATLLINVLCLLAFPIFMLVEMDRKIIFGGVLALVAITGIAGSFLLGGAFSTSTQFSYSHPAHITSGMGCAGVLASILRIVTKAVFPSKDITWGKRICDAIYFVIAAAIMLATFGYFLWKLNTEKDMKERMNPTNTEFGIELRGLGACFLAIWPIWVSNALNFAETLLLFPGYVCQVPQRKPWLGWTPLIITSLYSVCDWIGKVLPMWVHWPSEKWAWLPFVPRLLFFVIFMISLQGVADLGEPYWTFAWMIPFAVSSGFVGTVTVVHGNNHSKIRDTEDGMRCAGFLMNLAVNIGILLAMSLTFALPEAKPK
jgi:equilibrative nucleoside transporter 1/2/3